MIATCSSYLENDNIETALNACDGLKTCEFDFTNGDDSTYDYMATFFMTSVPTNLPTCTTTEATMFVQFICMADDEDLNVRQV
jgi:hypothetical protein